MGTSSPRPCTEALLLVPNGDTLAPLYVLSMPLHAEYRASIVIVQSEMRDIIDQSFMAIILRMDFRLKITKKTITKLSLHSKYSSAYKMPL